eukprot:SAG31_NODE_70_length_28117_cov_100.521843_19_plen_30_part_00
MGLNFRRLQEDVNVEFTIVIEKVNEAISI